MVDRSARNQTAAAIEAYLDDRITAFEFDERLGIETDDPLVAEVASLAWFHYDDCKDHQVVLDTDEWNLFQRLLLLLKSDAELTSEFHAPSRRRWEWDHKLACLGFVTYCLLALLVGWNGWLLVLALPFAPLSRFIHAHRVRTTPVMSARELGHLPFASFKELRQVRQRTPGFTKRRYRTEISGRVVRGEVQRDINRAMLFVGWVSFSPLVLLWQSIAAPERESMPWRLKLA